MEPKPKKPKKTIFNIEYIDPKDDWIDKMDHTHFMMIALDILEVDVEDRNLADAKRMLRRIGISC